MTVRGGVPVRRWPGARAMSGGVAAAPFSPASLFASGEQGAWYDPSDLSTMFQDSAGATPVTALGQPVGRINSRAGAYEFFAPLFANGEFGAVYTIAPAYMYQDSAATTPVTATGQPVGYVADRHNT